MWAFAGMGFIISVGYMDPGNWATDITAGSLFGYVLLIAVLLSSITAMFLQACNYGIMCLYDLNKTKCMGQHLAGRFRGQKSILRMLC